MESQPQNPEFRNNPENFHPCINEIFSYYSTASYFVSTQKNHLSEVILLSNQNPCLNPWIRK